MINSVLETIWDLSLPYPGIIKKVRRADRYKKGIGKGSEVKLAHFS